MRRSQTLPLFAAGLLVWSFFTSIGGCSSSGTPGTVLGRVVASIEGLQAGVSGELTLTATRDGATLTTKVSAVAATGRAQTVIFSAPVGAVDRVSAEFRVNNTVVQHGQTLSDNAGQPIVIKESGQTRITLIMYSPDNDGDWEEELEDDAVDGETEAQEGDDADLDPAQETEDREEETLSDPDVAEGDEEGSGDDVEPLGDEFEEGTADPDLDGAEDNDQLADHADTDDGGSEADDVLPDADDRTDTDDAADADDATDTDDSAADLADDAGFDTVDTAPGDVIPDNTPAGLVKSLYFGIPMYVSNVCVHVEIAHGRVGDLYLELTAPNGSSSALKTADSGDASVDLSAVYITWFSSLNAQGTWTFKAVDQRAGVEGRLLSWILEFDCVQPDGDLEIEAADESEEDDSPCVDDGNPCTVETWNGSICVISLAKPGTLCEEGNLCTGPDACDEEGVCIGGGPVDCSDNNDCTTEYCEPSQGCIYPQLTSGPCDDRSVCTSGDQCINGQCVGVFDSCDDGNPCTGTACNASTGCLYEPLTATSCDDGRRCTGPDLCVAGVCVGGGQTCGGAQCLSYSCNEADGCSSTTLPPATPCETGVKDAENDQCANGVCHLTLNTAPGRTDMVKVGATMVNIDRFEAVASLKQDCTGPFVGQNSDNYPAGFPDDVGLGGGIQTTPVYACSLAGVTPSRHLTWYQAKQACQNAGKYLCGFTPWQSSCQGPGVTTYPYGDTYNGAVCNGADFIDFNGDATDRVRPTAMAEACGNLYGAHDLSGNVEEWIDYTEGSGKHYVMGGDASSTGTALRCNAYQKQESRYTSSMLGFRCCWTFDPSTVDCDDKNPCTRDEWDGVECSHATLNGDSCDDANPCTDNDRCRLGLCAGDAVVCGDESNPCAEYSCNSITGCQTTYLDVACNDANACTINDHCYLGVCLGTRKVCNDGNECTVDSCDETGGCRYEVRLNASCNDNNACTANDICRSDGHCRGTAKVCEGSGQCADASCQPATGACVLTYPTRACNDGNACTTGETCVLGNCIGALLSCDDANSCTTDTCSTTLGCQHAVRSVSCNDYKNCTVNDQCSPDGLGGAVCLGQSLDCDDGIDCTADSCDEEAGGCRNVRLTGTSCNDDNPCTINDTCANGECIGTATTCDDGDPCTRDSCNISQGGCTHLPVTGGSCNDDDACTANDVCSNGICKGTRVPQDYCNDNNLCTTDRCDPALGCVHDFNTYTCNDGNSCTTGDICVKGVCIGSATHCDDHNPCTEDVCLASGSCGHYPQTGSPCGGDAGSLCMVRGVCSSGGECIGYLNSCDDHNACTRDHCTCDGGADCVCADDSMHCDCAVDDCLCEGTDCAMDGGCYYEPIAAAELVGCNDNNPCTNTDRCDNGVCKGQPEDCSNLDGPCAVGICSRTSGSCIAFPREYGAACDDNNPDTSDSYCVAGSCIPSGNCPGHPDMALIPGSSWCIDRYESGIFDNKQCTGTQVGVVGDDYPGRFDDLVGMDSGSDSLLYYACPGPGVTPSGWTTYFQARQACLNMGKQLCTPALHQSACRGLAGRSYPYGATYNYAACVGLDYPVVGDRFPAGEAAACVTPEGVYDLVGNMGEWLENYRNVGGSNSYNVSSYAASYWNSPAASMMCQTVADHTAYPNQPGQTDTMAEAFLGVRCCAPSNPTDCDDLNPCTIDAYAEGSGCTHTPLTGTQYACDDGNLCDTNDYCVAGVCIGGTASACDDGNPCTINTCDPRNGCSSTNITSGACIHSDPCVASATCVEGQCVEQTYKTCDDNNPCTSQSCVNGACQYYPVSASCDDGSVCTENDQCSAGVCQGAPVNCDDFKECTIDVCHPLLGCQYSQIAIGSVCDDRNLCTVGDLCRFDGSCGGGQALNCDDGNPCTTDECYSGEGCVHTYLTLLYTSCNDANACTENDRCTLNAFGEPVCQGTFIDCSDGNSCTDNWCDSTLGCQTRSREGKPCNDTNICTVGETCRKVGGVAECVADSYLSCDDGNICTYDQCDLAVGCIHLKLPNSCNDKDACTLFDACDDGFCRGVAVGSCDDGNPCTYDYCNPEYIYSGGVYDPCVHQPIVRPCDDGLTCTYGDACNASGSCVGSRISCDDGNSCTTDVCKEPFECSDGSCAAGCNHTALTGAFCEDGNVCTINDQCAAGVCAAGVAACIADDNPCTNDYCDPLNGACMHDPFSGGLCSDNNACSVNDQCINGVCTGETPGVADLCGDDNFCTHDSCDSLVGCINNAQVMNGQLCPDDLYCTVNETCAGGVCAKSERSCPANEQCRTYYCDEDVDTCLSQDVADGVSCNDGNPATLNDACKAGACVGVLASVCPGHADMKLLSSALACIDAYEAFLASTSACGGAVYGRQNDDYPAGFPDTVGDGGGTQTTAVYACNAAGVLPSRFLTWYQAKQACANAGKRLCSIQEWRLGCNAGEDAAYPYGDAYQSAVCVDSYYDGFGGVGSGDVARASGAAAGCVNSRGVYDMSGNVREWASNSMGSGRYLNLGGGYATTDQSLLACQASFSSPWNDVSADLGLRCCVDVALTDGDADADQSGDAELPSSCQNDDACPAYYYCEQQQCILGCTRNQDCGAGYCDPHGRCQ